MTNDCTMPAAALGTSLFAAVLGLAVASPAAAACTSRRCGPAEAAAVAAVRAEIDAACDCAGSESHRAYARCARQLARAARRDGRLRTACAKAVRRCEARSTCGRAGAVVCCTEKAGAPVGRVRQSAGACGPAAVACTDQPRAADACLAGPACCRAVVERGPPDVIVPGSGFELVSGLEVRATAPEGCADLDGSLIALNYFSLTDRDAYLRYAAAVVDVLQAFGHRAIVAGHRLESFLAPPGEPATGGAYDHEVFALARYASAGGFLDFVRSEEQQRISADRSAGAREDDYVWGLQRCLRGCDGAPPPPADLLLAHIFRYEGEDIDAAVEALAAAAGAPPLFYAGETVAELRVHIGAISFNPQKPPWGRGAVVFRVPSREAALAWVGDPAYVAFRAETAEDVVMLLAQGI